MLALLPRLLRALLDGISEVSPLIHPGHPGTVDLPPDPGPAPAVPAADPGPSPPSPGTPSPLRGRP